jgi:hypothetical protein
MLGCVVSPMGKEEDPRQCWVSAEVVRPPKTTDTPRHSCIVKGKCSQVIGQEKVSEKNRKRKDIPEETPDAQGVQNIIRTSHDISWNSVRLQIER